MMLHGLAIVVLARAYVFRTFLFNLFVLFSYVVRTYSVHFLWAGGWSGLGPGVSNTNKE